MNIDNKQQRVVPPQHGALTGAKIKGTTLSLSQTFNPSPTNGAWSERTISFSNSSRESRKLQWFHLYYHRHAQNLKKFPETLYTYIHACHSKHITRTQQTQLDIVNIYSLQVWRISQCQYMYSPIPTVLKPRCTAATWEFMSALASSFPNLKLHRLILAQTISYCDQIIHHHLVTSVKRGLHLC